jgi:hypothetical protein
MKKRGDLRRQNIWQTLDVDYLRQRSRIAATHRWHTEKSSFSNQNQMVSMLIIRINHKEGKEFPQKGKEVPWTLELHHNGVL